MGLLGFYPLLKRCGYAPSKHTGSHFISKVVAIDGDAMLYKILHAYTTGPFNVAEMTNRTERFVGAMTDMNIRPIVVFSGGPPPPEKEACLSKRKEAREKRIQRALELKRTAEQESVSTEDSIIIHDKVRRLLDAARCISRSDILQVGENLTNMGVDVRMAPSEADFVLTSLSKNKECDYVACDDGDILVSGASHIVRGFAACVLHGQKADVYARADILCSTKLTSAQLVQLGLLLRCDYLSPIQGLGAIGALRVIQSHGSIEAFLQSRDFESTTRTTKKRKYTLPTGMDTISYTRQCRRTVCILTGNNRSSSNEST